MLDDLHLEIIQSNPIGSRLDYVHSSFKSICFSKGISRPCPQDALRQFASEDAQGLSLDLISALQSCKASRLLPASGPGKNLHHDLSRFSTAINSDDFHLDQIKPLLEAVLVNTAPDDILIWQLVYCAVLESTPPPRPTASSFSQTPWRCNTSAFANSSDYRQDVDRVLKAEFGVLYVGLAGFTERFFGNIAGLEVAAGAVLAQCREGEEQLLVEGRWVGWPNDANQADVLTWLADIITKLAALAESDPATPSVRRRLLAQPNTPIKGSTAERKIDVGLVSVTDREVPRAPRCHWREILIPGELKSNPAADIHSKAWLDLGRYAREVLAAQDTRRFVIGFTLCGPYMRIWEYDRLGGIASDKFDIHKDAFRFVSTILGFLWMSDEDLGFDPTIYNDQGRHVINIQRQNRTERLIIDRVIRRAACVAGRATTCWKAHLDCSPDQPLVVKDSWQYTERVNEGELLQEITELGVVNVARYYHHETVQVSGTDDDIRHNVRKGLDITTADNHRSGRSSDTPSPRTMTCPPEGRSSTSIVGRKRSSSPARLALSSRKRHQSRSASLSLVRSAQPNRIHRRVVIRDYGEPIYKASSPPVLLRAFVGCIQGHQSLRSEAGLLHRDISVNNMMVNEQSDTQWPGFLIDLDLSVKESRVKASGAQGKTGTRAFMAVGALLGEQHSFMHDLESFFWVLFWICIHYHGPGHGNVVEEFDEWNFLKMETLATTKLGTVSDEDLFFRTMRNFFTEYYKPLMPWVNRLRRVVFPGGRMWKSEDEGLYASMIEVLQAAEEHLLKETGADPAV
ncbi:protein kinase family protein [Aspergillus aculeatinus CBS 121060]|uniref:Uncharacterized protein n=1 Tax=Aspergillus aculeatinus CBS 121060 TaxID=1448322 RepID=A0ACD1H519_9EURO|nr:hypothetical protein BO66DRAFT_439889 [Aspergillus aculeatinus CBS 121060]RAH68883.1 hypothetical protein BO66DRAFT_439889 [Aspergillus aculeatinus CBS 121060]